VIDYGYIPVASDFMDEQHKKNIKNKFSSIFNEFNIEEIREPGLADICFYFIITGGTEQQVLDLIKNDTSHKYYLLAYGDNNSLPASLEILARLQLDGKKGEIIYLQNENDRVSLDRVINPKRRTLPGKRIGLVGQPSDWLVASSPVSKGIEAEWQVKVVDVPLNELQKDFLILRKELSQSTISANYPDVAEPSQTELLDAEAVYLALKQIVKRYKLDALTLRCFDLVLDNQTTGCYALARLNDEGIIAGCEGDIISALGLLWAKEKFGKTAWMANPARIYPETNELVIAHCTLPLSLCENVKVRSHFESGLGVAFAGTLPLGKVTIFRLGGSRAEKIWIAKGEIIEVPTEETLCRTQVRIKLSDKYRVSELLTQPLGNHLIMVYGEISP